MTPKPSIAIVGAGPSGLTFARILHQGGITSTLFELDASASARGQGGTLDIHEESGQRAIAAAGLTAEFQKIARPEDDMLRLADKTGFLHINQENPGQERPEVDRAQLRRMFVESLPADCIRWGSKVVSVAPESAGNKFAITLADGSTAGGFDLVVGADGAWSRVRPLLTDVTPFYSGISSVEFHTTHPDMLTLVGRGSYFCLSDNKALFAQRQGDGSVRTYTMLRVPETSLEDQAFQFPQDKRRLVEEHFGDWSEANKNLMGDEGGGDAVGDAAHVMTPFAGEGVNNALVDGMELAQEVLKSPGDLGRAVREYERGMFGRMGKMAEETMRGLEMIFNDRAPIPFKEFMESQMPPPE
ncbi:monooxygenase FAD-binding protein [Hymenopellis radicata]|nr:monooxygenase FAD-binding protein [Hymenopellis radicata]